ncbi:MAG: hypothetical protein KF699_08670 [Phycisphaeraceae bacterium]|nr:hypothetical protein [Phycisphaeraceae bacterium]
MDRLVIAFLASLSLVMLALAFAQPSTELTQQGVRSELPPVKIDEGLEVQPRRVKWLVGPWQFAHDRTQQFEIKEEVAGTYLMTPKPAGAGEEMRLIVFKVDCHRLVQMRSTAPNRPMIMTYALLSGHAERLSLDVLPAVFPAAWKDEALSAAIGSEDAGEVPVSKRIAALEWLVGQIDETGTLMRQDRTYFRPQD